MERNPGLVAETIARELQVTRRTVYRAIDRLRAEGARIAGSAGKGGGYMIRRA